MKADSYRVKLKNPPPASLRLDSEEIQTILRHINFKSQDTVFLSGSRAEGWDNSSSDYDFYVLGKDHSAIEAVGGLSLPLIGDRVKLHYFILGSRRIEIQYWHSPDVIEFAKKTREHALRPLTELWSKQVELLHRIRIGIPVFNEKEFTRLYQKIDFPALDRYLAQFYLRVHDAYFQDTLGSLSSGRLIDAVLVGRMAVDQIIDAYLALRQQSNPQPKWRYQKLLRVDTGSGALTADYLNILQMTGGKRKKLYEYAVNCLTLSENVSASIQVNCDYDEFITEKGGRRLPLNSRTSQVKRQVDVRLRRLLNGKLVLNRNDGETLEINETAAILWLLADGRNSETDMVDSLAQRYKVKRARLSRDVTRLIQSLLGKGVLTYNSEAKAGLRHT